METGAAATINPTVSYYADQQQSKRKNPPVKLVGQEPKNAPPSTLPPPTSSLPPLPSRESETWLTKLHELKNRQPNSQPANSA